MNFITFSTNSTTIFPLANSTTGSQLLSEYNLRVRDSVATSSNISYMSCPSYAHSMDDFYVRIQEDASGAITNSYVLEILAGKAMINGHYIENTDSMTVDLVAANNELASMSLNPLSGNLAIGIRAYYSTEESMSGGITEHGDETLFQGVQLVVLPEKELLTPEDTPDDKNKITCHLKLATFDFVNDVVTNVRQNSSKVEFIKGERISNIEDMISGAYVSSTGLNAKKLYTYSGKGSAEHDTWCDSTGSLMTWDNNPVKTTTKPSEVEAGFTISTRTEAVELVVPHQQIDGMVNSVGEPEYYQSKTYTLPVANYSTNTPGTVTGAYAKSIKEVENKFNNFYRLPGDGRQISFPYEGKQRQFIPIYDPEGSTDGQTFTSLPLIPQSFWNIGDYVVVKEDRTFEEGDGTTLSYPSTFYSVIPGKIVDYAFYGKTTSDSIPTSSSIAPLRPYKLDGVELARIDWPLDSPPETVINVTGEPVTRSLAHGNLISPNEDGVYATLSFPSVSSTVPVPSSSGTSYVPTSYISPIQLTSNNINKETGEFINLSNSGIVERLIGDDIQTLNTIRSQLTSEVSKLRNIENQTNQVKSDNKTMYSNISSTISKIENAIGAANSTGLVQACNNIYTYASKMIDILIGRSSSISYLATSKANPEVQNIIAKEGKDDNPSSRSSLSSARALNEILIQIAMLASKGNNEDMIPIENILQYTIQPSLRSIYNNIDALLYSCNNYSSDMDRSLNSIITSTEGVISDINTLANLIQQYTSMLNERSQSDITRVLNMTASYSYVASNTENVIADYAKYNGYAYHDYFTVVYTNPDTDQTTYYYYMVTESLPKTWSEPSLITSSMPLADQTSIGGFKNIDTSDVQYIDGGYVVLNDDGNLQLVDYALLRAGVAAYQLGQDFTFDTGTTIEEIQSFLDEYVNDRVAFPNTQQQIDSQTPNVINIYITLPADADDKSTPLIIKDIDSRFNTSVYFHFTVEGEDASSNSGVTIYIMDCQKVRIDSDIVGNPVINIYRSCLYYDCEVLNYILRCDRDSYAFTGLEDITFWYEMFESTDPDLVVNEMTITQVNTPIITEDIDYWNTTTPNDNHYLTALKSVTFASDGTIMGCELLLANQSTDNVQTGQKLLVGQFELPQGRGLKYPKSCLLKQLKVTGTFSSCYYTSGYWAVSTTNFSALTQSYSITDLTQTGVGSIAFNTNTTLVEADLGKTIEQGGIPPFESDSYHIFSGGVIS